jgi:hypothetical protein
MNRLTRWQKGTIASFGLIFLALTVLQPMVFTGGAQAATVSTTSDEAYMLELLNQARNQAGLPSLYAEQRLTDFARAYSSEMIQYNFFSHVSPVSGNLQQRIAARGITGWKLAGENLAKAPSVDVAFDALMNSQGHRENILNQSFNCVGIGVVKSGGTLYITQEFMYFSPLPSTADVPVASQPAAPAPAPAPGSDSFDSYLLIMNPNRETAEVEVIFQGEEGSNSTFHYSIGPNSRFTVPVRETLGSGSFSIEINSSLPVLSERAMYFDYENRTGGHDSIGAEKPSTTWFFAEGYTAGSFDTWVLLQNPNQVTATVTLSFMQPDGAVITRQVNVPAQRRQSVHVDEIPGLEAADVSTQVTSNLPITAERAMYFNYQGKDGGSATIGATKPSNSWYFAEGYTGDSFDTWVLLQNPNDSAALVTLDFMKPDGSIVSRQVSVPARRRHSVHVDEIPGLEATDVSTRVRSDLPVVAERAMYFNYGGDKKGGHVTIGAMEPENNWYLAEGYTGGDFDEYVLLVNPGEEAAGVDVVFMRPDGMNVSRRVNMDPHSRHTIHVDEIAGLESAEVSTKVCSSVPIVVERAQYFNFRGIREGSDSIGSNQPSCSWYFAEGCVK